MSGPYQLIDFGDGRKLESLGGRLIDRPSPAAEYASPRKARLWRDAESRFDLDSKTWTHHTPWPEDLAVEFLFGDAIPANKPDSDHHSGEPSVVPLVLPVQPTPFGHIGVFPEQAGNWRWLLSTAESTASASSSRPSLTPRRTSTTHQQALNLFAYTGGSTTSMARTGMKVAHVDAAKPNVEAAKRVALANGLAEAPIRYLVDDAAAFVQREIRRGNRYHTIVMDPPAYGHGPKTKLASRKKSDDGGDKRPGKQAKAWRIQRDLPELIKDCVELIAGKSFRILITGHSAEMDEANVLDILRRQLANRRIGRMNPKFQTGRMTLVDQAGRHLDAGFYVRCHGQLPDQVSV